MKTNHPPLNRRRALSTLGAAVVTLPLAGMLSACEGGTGDVEPFPDGGGSGDTGGDAGASTGAWLIGGTAAMVNPDNYPDPFTTGRDNGSCDLMCALTLGPCYAPTAPVRRDVTEGREGIPVRLALRVVASDGCTPVPGAEIEIWQCDIDGVYSGDDVNQGDFCTAGEAAAEAAYWFRGRAIVDDNGVVVFDSTYPGWYPSRAIHIHFLVRRAAFAGGVQDTDASVVSQLFFPEALTTEIFNDVDGYAQKGQPDTTFANDTVVGSVSDAAAYVVDYEQMPDGAMLAWKTIAISDDASCGNSGGGPGGPGGPPTGP